MGFAIVRAGPAVGSLPLPRPRSRPESEGPARRRIFTNAQLIERSATWLRVCGFSQATEINYTRAVRSLAAHLGERSLVFATPADVRGFLAAELDRGVGRSTMQAELYSLRSFYSFLLLGDLVRVNPARDVSPGKAPKRLPRVLSVEEVERLIGAAGSPRDRAILELLYAAGLRVSELANLRLEDLNLKARSLIVRQGKGGNDRLSLFGRPAAAALQEYIGNRTSGFVFLPHPPHRQRGGLWRGKYGIWYGQWRVTDENGKHMMRTVRLGDYEIPNRERARLTLDAYLADKLPHDKAEAPQRRLTTRRLHRVVVNAAKRAGLGHVHPHQFRHAFATHCLNGGMNIRFVQELLGHSSLSTTSKYLHLATADLQRVHAQFHPRG